MDNLVSKIETPTYRNIIKRLLSAAVENAVSYAVSEIAESASRNIEDLVAELLGTTKDGDIEELKKTLSSIEANLIKNNFNQKSIEEYEKYVKFIIEDLESRKYNKKTDTLFLLLMTEKHFNTMCNNKIKYVFDHLSGMDKKGIGDIKERYDIAVEQFITDVSSYGKGDHLYGLWNGLRYYLGRGIHPEKKKILDKSVSEIKGEMPENIFEALARAENFKENLQKKETELALNPGEADKALDRFIQSLKSICSEVNEKNDPLLGKYIKEYVNSEARNSSDNNISRSDLNEVGASFIDQLNYLSGDLIGALKEYLNPPKDTKADALVKNLPEQRTDEKKEEVKNDKDEEVENERYQNASPL